MFRGERLMTPERDKELLPVFKSFAEGKKIECKD